jgi:hypothetical protein
MLDDVAKSGYAPYAQVRDERAGLPGVPDVHAFNYADRQPDDDDAGVAAEATVG